MDATSASSATTGHADPEGHAPWATQLVVRIERDRPPARTAVCEAAAIAVVRLLASEEAQGDWQPAIGRWLEGRIRKHARRACGAKRDQAQALPGVTVAHVGAEVRAFVPCPTDQIAVEAAKLRMSRLELDDLPPHSRRVPPGPSLRVSAQPDPWLPTGKTAVLRCHAVPTCGDVRRGPRRDTHRVTTCLRSFSTVACRRPTPVVVAPVRPQEVLR